MHHLRVHPRVVARLAAEIRKRGADEWNEALLHDLSAGGAAIHTPGPLPIQDEIDLRFRFPAEDGGEETAIEVACLVVRSEAAAEAAPERLFDSGLHFLNLHGESFDRVRAYVWKVLDPD